MTPLGLSHPASYPVRQPLQCPRKARHPHRTDGADRLCRPLLDFHQLPTLGDREEQLRVDVHTNGPSTPAQPAAGHRRTSAVVVASWVNAGVAAESTTENSVAIAPGNPDPTGVDTNNTNANAENTAAGPAARAFMHNAAPPIENNSKIPTLGMTITHPSNRAE
jgi:hypothetical protein